MHIPGTGRFCLIALLLAAGVPSAALAQDEQGEEARKSAIEEVIVTAQRREESLMDVPVSVTA